ncbi:MAG: DUF3221 domain-containing protein [Thermoflexaceae bacterium]|nr:DUF3221 domain-containing protein [Thermoflexaceae bacterium]
MKNNKKIILLIVGILLILVFLIVSIFVFRKTGANQSYFNAVVQEIGQGQVLVAPVEGSRELNSSDLIWVTTTVVSANGVPSLKAGDTIRIVYNGMIAESYPAQIDTVFAIYLVKDGKVILNKAE